MLSMSCFIRGSKTLIHDLSVRLQEFKKSMKISNFFYGDTFEQSLQRWNFKFPLKSAHIYFSWSYLLRILDRKFNINVFLLSLVHNFKKRVCKTLVTITKRLEPKFHLVFSMWLSDWKTHTFFGSGLYSKCLKK